LCQKTVKTYLDSNKKTEKSFFSVISFKCEIEILKCECKKLVVFVVFSWLDTGCEDRKTERTLFPVGEIPTDSTVSPNVKSRKLFNFIICPLDA